MTAQAMINVDGALPPYVSERDKKKYERRQISRYQKKYAQGASPSGGNNFVRHAANRLHQLCILRQALRESSAVRDGNHAVFVGNHHVDGIAELQRNFQALIFGEGINTRENRFNLPMPVVLRRKQFHCLARMFDFKAAVYHCRDENEIGNLANVERYRIETGGQVDNHVAENVRCHHDDFDETVRRDKFGVFGTVGTAEQ